MTVRVTCAELDLEQVIVDAMEADAAVRILRTDSIVWEPGTGWGSMTPPFPTRNDVPFRVRIIDATEQEDSFDVEVEVWGMDGTLLDSEIATMRRSEGETFLSEKPFILYEGALSPGSAAYYDSYILIDAEEPTKVVAKKSASEKKEQKATPTYAEAWFAGNTGVGVSTQWLVCKDQYLRSYGRGYRPDKARFDKAQKDNGGQAWGGFDVGSAPVYAFTPGNLKKHVSKNMKVTVNLHGGHDPAGFRLSAEKDDGSNWDVSGQDIADLGIEPWDLLILGCQGAEIVPQLKPTNWKGDILASEKFVYADMRPYVECEAGVTAQERTAIETSFADLMESYEAKVSEQAWRTHWEAKFREWKGKGKIKRAYWDFYVEGLGVRSLIKTEEEIRKFEKTGRRYTLRFKRYRFKE